MWPSARLAGSFAICPSGSTDEAIQIHSVLRPVFYDCSLCGPGVPVSEFESFVQKTLARGARIKTKRNLVISMPTDSTIKKKTIRAGATGVVVQVLPNFVVRLDRKNRQGQVCEIRWHSSLNISEDIEPIETKPTLWLVK